MSWTFTTSGAAVVKAGTSANSGITASGAILAKWSEQSEGRIMAETETDWLTNFSSLVSGAKLILDDVSSSMIAMQIINFDMSGYTSRVEAQTMLDIQDDIISNGIRALKQLKNSKIGNPP